MSLCVARFFFNDTATTEIYTLSLHDALPIYSIEHGCLLGLEPDLLKVMADGDIYLVPTFTVFTFHATQGNPHAQAEAQGFRQQHIDTVQQALSAGVKVVAGTEIGRASGRERV